MRVVKLYLMALTFVLSIPANPTTGMAATSILCQDSVPWGRYTADDEELPFCFQRPSVSVFSDQGRTYRYATYSNGVVYSVTSHKYDANNFTYQVYINNEIFRRKDIEFTFVKSITLGKFTGKQYSLKKKEFSGIANYYGTERRVYFVQAMGADKNHPAVQRFLDSFTIGKKPDAIDIGKGARSIEEPPDPDQAKEPVYKTKELSRSAIIVFGPTGLPPKARRKNAPGVVVLKTIFRPSGRVIDIEVVSGLPDGLTEIAIEQARKIYFLPALKDGRAVSQYVQLEFNQLW